MMGYYRIISGDPLREGDIVVWEYAINDEELILKGEVSAKSCLRYIELSIMAAISSGARFIPMIFDAKNNAFPDRLSEYKAGLKLLLSSYGISAVNVTDEYCRRYKTSRVPESQYLHRVHYGIGSTALAMAVELCYESTKRSTLPQLPHATCFEAEPEKVLFLSNFTGGSKFKFINSILEISVARPSAGDTLLAKPPAGNWILVGAILLRNKERGFIKIFSETDSVTTRTFHLLKNYQKPALGMVTFSRDTGILASSENPVRVDLVRSQHLSQAPNQPEGNSDFGIVALHFEEVMDPALTTEQK